MPLAPEPNDARAVHGATGLGYASLPEPAEPADRRPRGRRASSPRRARTPGELILVATGPLTNIALARDARARPAAPRQALRASWAAPIREGGNVTPSAEFNIWHDPEAARERLPRLRRPPARAPIVAVGLDVTRKATIDGADLARARRPLRQTPRALALMRFLEDSARFYFERMERQTGRRFLIMHDPLAVAVALDPALVETRRAAVDVETAGRLTTGATVVDWEGRWGRLANAEVAVAVDAERFRAKFLDAMVRVAGDR